MRDSQLHVVDMLCISTCCTELTVSVHVQTVFDCLA